MDRGAGVARLGSDDALAVDTERTWLVCERANARVTALEEVAAGNLIFAV